MPLLASTEIRPDDRSSLAPFGPDRRGPDRAAPCRRPGSARRRCRAEEVARLEARHLKKIRQVTSGLARAGEGYFSPDGQSIIFQAVPHVPPSIFHQPKPDEDGYQIFLGP